MGKFSRWRIRHIALVFSNALSPSICLHVGITVLPE